MQLKKIFSLAIACFFISNVFAQTDSTGSCNLRISLLTCAPGTELYSTFGHSAIRVVNYTDSSDIIFNYGTFDFDDPSFYSKFVKGKLLYFVSVDEFENFIYQYQYEQRGITEQTLNLSCSEKENLLAALKENAKEENKYYKYDFVRDNCTTRLRDIVFAKSNGPVATKDIRPKKNVSSRDLIHEYLDRGHQPWSKLGIDILLGAPVDKNISNSEAMFLPDYLLKAFDSTTVSSKPLVEEKSVVLSPVQQPGKRSFFTPFVVFLIIFLIIAALSFFHKASKFFLIF